MTFEEFEQALLDTLFYLHNPIYQPADLLCAVLGQDARQGSVSVREAIFQAIRELEPDPNGPSDVRTRRYYEILSSRYIHGLTQNEIALRLNLSSRHLRREQQRAIRLLAQQLWEQSRTRVEKSGEQPAGEETEREEPTWRSQVRQELATLQESDPDPTANVAQEVQRVVRLAQALAARHHVGLSAQEIPAELTAGIHPAVLRQILVTAIEKLAQHMSAGQITISTNQAGTDIEVTVAGEPVTTTAPLRSDFVWEILAAEGGGVTVHHSAQRAAFELRLPSAGKVTVLVIDDNLDLVYLYRRYTAMTPYQIHHLTGGQNVYQQIEAIRPDIIVLDVMLPDIDGWELLIDLHEHSATKEIPVIVCSVIRRQELALTLGAAVYLAKPVRRQEFIQALDQVRSWVSSE